MADDDIADQIEIDAQGPKKATGDFGSWEKHSLKEQIEADRYLRAKRGGTVKMGKITTPGAA